MKTKPKSSAGGSNLGNNNNSNSSSSSQNGGAGVGKNAGRNSNRNPAAVSKSVEGGDGAVLSKNRRKEASAATTMDPHLAPYDEETHCPTYALVATGEGEVDDSNLDMIQMELENLLMYNMQRQIKLVRLLDDNIRDGDHPWTDLLYDQLEKTPMEPVSSMKLKLSSRRSAGTGSVNGGSNGDMSSSTPGPSSALGGTSESGIGTGRSNTNTPLRTHGLKGQRRIHIPGNVSPSATYAPVNITDNRGRKRVYFWPQNHMPDKFWTFVSDYSSPVTQEDVEVVEELIEDNKLDKNQQFFTISSSVIGINNTAGSDGGGGGQQQQAAGKIGSRSTRSSTSTPAPTTSRGTKRKATADISAHHSDSPTGTSQQPTAAKKQANGLHHGKHTGGGPKQPSHHDTRSSNGTGGGSGDIASSVHHSLGPLTERLVQALLEDNDNPTAIPEVNGMSSPQKALVRSLNLGNMAALEKRIRRELEQQGLLEKEEGGDESGGGGDGSGGDESGTDSGTGGGGVVVDEVSRELEQRELELRSVMETNKIRLAAFLPKLENDIEREELNQQLEIANQQVVNLFDRFYSSIPKRKPSSKKEKDLIWKAIKDRNKLIESIDALQA